MVESSSVYEFCLMSTKFCKVKVEENTASEPSSVADAIEAFLQNVIIALMMLNLFYSRPSFTLAAYFPKCMDVVIRACDLNFQHWDTFSL